MAKCSTDVVERNLERVNRRIESACLRAGRSPDSVRLVAVTKYTGMEEIRSLYDLGVRDFGESRPQSIWDRQPKLPANIRWHLIGPWQSNKVRRTLPLIHLAHSIDRASLAEVVSSESVRQDRRAAVLLEVKLTNEPTKHGYSPEELREAYPRLVEWPGLHVLGLMGMGPLTDNATESRAVFRRLRMLRDELRREHPGGPRLDRLSMGMSGDFEVAIEEGATDVRIGSMLFEASST